MSCRALQAPSTGPLWASQRAVARRGGPRRSGCRPCLRHPVRVLGQRSASSVRCERPVSTRACPRDRCPVRASERPGVGVRCGRPVSVRSRVRCPTGVRSWSAAVGRQPPAGMAGVGVVARRVHGRLVVCPSQSMALEAGAGLLGQRRRRLGLGRRRGRWLGSGRVDRVADQNRPDAREDRPSLGSRGAQRGSPSCARLRGTSDLHHCCSESAEDRAPDVELGIGSCHKSQRERNDRLESIILKAATTLRGRRCGRGLSRLVSESLPGWTAT